MVIKNIIDEDFTNYYKCSMVIGFPHCTFKCEKDCGMQGLCQNSALAKSPNIDIPVTKLIERYVSNPLTQAIVCAGLEPFDDFDDLLFLVQQFRLFTEDDIVIYTGYYADEILPELRKLKRFSNIVIKFGRYIPNQEKHYDEVLGIYLASDNQSAEKIS